MSRYSRICCAIMKTADEDNVNYRDFARQWIMLFEKTRVVGFNRDEFLECLAEEKEAYKK